MKSINTVLHSTMMFMTFLHSAGLRKLYLQYTSTLANIRILCRRLFTKGYVYYMPVLHCNI